MVPSTSHRKLTLRTSQALALYTVADEPGGDRTVGKGQGDVEEGGGDAAAAMGSESPGFRIKYILTLGNLDHLL